MKHTKGPWIIQGSSTLNIISKNTSKGRRVCSLLSISDEDIKNANLISAAPDMLEALEQAKIRLECAGLNDTTLDTIKAAIKKANGEL